MQATWEAKKLKTMKKEIVTKQDLKTLKSKQRLYKVEYRDCNGETIHTQNIGLTTYEEAEELASKHCPKDRFIETWGIVPTKPEIDCNQLPVNMGFPVKMEGIILDRATGQYVEHESSLSIAIKKHKYNQLTDKVPQKARPLHFGQLGLSVGFSGYKQY